ncbi:transporter family-2 protein [Yoonia maricola]|uniref:Transporter family-2 protein n=1 Tax=Yoonia maricola TaxID=420999 RepID=A0A2M8WNM0_9RHOB|nr:DMT family transporter [Yoonia maricola]PJI92519.1 transporter family-2 protein [Yoonia maricola]
MPHHILIMLAAGIGIPVLAALNAALGRHIGSPAVAATVLFVVAFAISASVAMMTNPQAVTKLITAPKHLFLGGTFVAFYVLSITWIAPSMGVGNAVFLVLLGQLISAAAIDHFGLFSAQAAPLTPTRAAGIALMAAGVFVTQKA